MADLSLRGLTATPGRKWGPTPAWKKVKHVLRDAP